MAKIAFLSFYSGVVDRGVEAFVYEISKRLCKKNQIVIFQAGSTSKNPLNVKTRHIKSFATIPKQPSGFFSKFYLDLQSLKILLFSLKSIPFLIGSKSDLIIPLNGGWQTLIARLITKITGAKLLISGHAGIGRDDTFNLFCRPDVFIALTYAQKNWAKKIAPEVRIESIPNGVDLARFNPQVKPQKLPLLKPIVICTSALIPYKRIELTIKAISKTRFSLLLLGDGQMRGFLDSLGKRLLAGRYLRLNPPYDQIPAYYRVGNVFTLASETEAFGISYLEAMACNLPVVTTNDLSRQEIIGNAGILTEPTHINRYAKDLTIAIKTKYRNVPYDQALKFSWNKIAQKYSKLIKELTT